jgi:hypothetical protein
MQSLKAGPDEFLDSPDGRPLLPAARLKSDRLGDLRLDALR